MYYTDIDKERLPEPVLSKCIECGKVKVSYFPVEVCAECKTYKEKGEEGNAYSSEL